MTISQNRHKKIHRSKEKKKKNVELLIVRTYERGPELQGRGPLNL